jgi:hypothetical protein
LSKFEWKLPLEDSNGKKVKSFAVNSTLGPRYTGVKFEDGSTRTFWTSNGRTYLEESSGHGGEFDVFLRKPEYVPTDEEVAAKYRETIKIAKGFYDMLIERGFKVVDPFSGDELFELENVAIVKEIRL